MGKLTDLGLVVAAQYFPVLAEDYELTSDRPQCEKGPDDSHYQEQVRSLCSTIVSCCTSLPGYADEQACADDCCTLQKRGYARHYDQMHMYHEVQTCMIRTCMCMCMCIKTP